MPASLYMPDVKVELALTSGYTTPAASRVWTDISDWVEAQHGIKIVRGRPDQFSSVQPSKCTLTLDNRDGRFTPEYVGGAYYPNIKKGRPIRVRAGVPNSTIVFDNFSTADSTIAVWDAPAGPGRTAPTGQTWAGDLKDWGVIGTQAYSSGVGGDVTIDAGVSDGEVECTFTTGATLADVGLNVRWVDVNNRIGVRVDTGGGGRWLIQKVVGGVTTNVANGGVAAASTTYNVKVILSGSSVQLYVNSVLTVSATIGDAVLLSATRHGLRGGATDYRWDDFWVRGTVYSTRFLGYVDEWPVDWPDGTASKCEVKVTASSRRARLGRSAAFRSIVEEEILYDGPKLHFPLGEPSGSTTAGNIAPGRSEVLTVTQIGAGGTLTFGAGTGPPTDDLTAPVFTPASTSNGKYLQVTLNSSVTEAGDTVLDIECSFVTSSAPTMELVFLGTNGDTSSIALQITGSGQVQLVAEFAGAGACATTGGPTVNDGAMHHASGRIVLTGGTGSVATASIIVDGGSRNTGSSTAGNVYEFPTFTTLRLGFMTTALPVLYTGTLAHVAVFSGTVAVTDARVQAHRNASVTGFAGEGSGARVARYARLAGIPTAEISTDTGMSTSIAHRDTTGRGPVEMMDDVAETEDGVVFDAGDGKLTFHARSRRYNVSSAFTLDLPDGDLETGLLPRLDDEGLTNEMTASRPSGVTVRSVNQGSVDEHGHYRDSVELMTTSDNEVQARADWQVNRFGTPRVSVPNVRVDLLNSDLKAQLLAADISTRFTLANLHAQAPSSTLDFFIEGSIEDIGAESYFIEFNVSAAAYANVWHLDSASFSQLDSSTVLAY